jgi:hypothetical protein
VAGPRPTSSSKWPAAWTGLAPVWRRFGFGAGDVRATAVGTGGRRRDRIQRVRWIASRGYVSFDVRKDYAEDGLYSIHDAGFRLDPKFAAACERGVRASDGLDPRFRWRVHVALWAASAALRVPGDFVECGVNAGFVSSAIMH